jgi:ABC-type transport system involved in cytochrome c biogenesis ATPase subunit
MKLTELKIRNFTVFEQADFAFAPGINVFIGENGTGKSHVLKALYAVLRGVRDQPMDKSEAERWQRERLVEIFKVGGGDVSAVSSLVRLGKDEEGATLWVTAGQDAETKLKIDQRGELVLTEQSWSARLEATFLPARDVLAMCEGFVPIYERHRISFDESYRDVCLALEQPELRGPEKLAADELSKPLRSMLGGEVSRENGRFHVDFGAGKHEAHLVAEGLRKIAALVQLVGNGSIRGDSVLLWDEPEANMNPRLIAKLAQALHGLAASGVQLFIATHDYLLSHKLSLVGEYEVEPRVEMRFFSLHRQGPLDPVRVEAASTLADIDNNAILDEYARHYEEERSLYQREVDRDPQGGAR